MYGKEARVAERPPLLEGRLKPPFDEDEVNGLWRDIESRQQKASARRALPRWTWPVPAVAALLAFLWWRPSPEPPAPLALADESPLPAVLDGAVHTGPLPLDDGSQLQLDRGAVLEVLRNDARELVTVLRKGRSTFDVRPGGERRWTIEAGLLRVQVIGTRFVVARDERSVRVQVERGVVLVRGAALPDGVRRLGAGESVSVDRPQAPKSVAASEPTILAEGSEPPAPVPERGELEPHPAPSRTAPRAAAPALPRPVLAPEEEPASWEQHVAAGDYPGAFSALQRAGGVAAIAGTTRDPRRLLALSDVAREVGQPALAVVPLERLVESSPEASEVPLAAFTLGKIELQALGHPAAATSWFTRALGHPSVGALAAAQRR